MDGQECLRTFSSYLCSSRLKLYSCCITKFDQVRFEPHGEACAFTLDYFIKFNADNADADGRITAFAQDCGFKNPYAMADEISAMKKRMGMKTTLTEIGCTTDEQIRELTEKSMSMLMTRNPIPLTENDIYKMYQELK